MISHKVVNCNGEKIMKDSNLTDDMGGLTEEGNKFAYEEGKAPMATESLLKEINTLAESKMSELDATAQEFIDDAMHSEDGSALSAAHNDGDEKKAAEILRRRATKDTDPLTIAAALAKMFNTDINKYL